MRLSWIVDEQSTDEQRPSPDDASRSTPRASNRSRIVPSRFLANFLVSCTLFINSGTGSSTACTRLRARPVVFEAMARIFHLRVVLEIEDSPIEDTMPSHSAYARTRLSTQTMHSKLEVLGQCVPPPRHVLPGSGSVSESPPKFNHLFIRPLTTFSENSVLKFCSHRQTNQQRRKHNLLGGGNNIELFVIKVCEVDNLLHALYTGCGINTALTFRPGYRQRL